MRGNATVATSASLGTRLGLCARLQRRSRRRVTRSPAQLPGCSADAARGGRRRAAVGGAARAGRRGDGRRGGSPAVRLAPARPARGGRRGALARGAALGLRRAAPRGGLGGAVATRARLGLAALRADLFDAAAGSHDGERRAQGALVMAAFGVGTLPAMVSATVAFDRAARALARGPRCARSRARCCWRSGPGPAAVPCTTRSRTPATARPPRSEHRGARGAHPASALK